MNLIVKKNVNSMLKMSLNYKLKLQILFFMVFPYLKVTKKLMLFFVWISGGKCKLNCSL